MPGFYGFYFDPTYYLVLIGAVLCMWASFRVNSTFKKYSRVKSRSNMTGAQAAAELLQRQGIFDVQIEHVNGNLTDHYDPRSKVLRLSDATYSSTSVAAIGVAAHECGHAIQHNEEYLPLKIRSTIVPFANFGCRFGIPIILLGLFLGQFFVELGIWVFAISVLFQIITLPVEFNASGRAVALLSDYGILDSEENGQCKKVLRAAALTYVAAAASSILQLLRLILLFGNRRDD
ncbi:MAG: zinc metallopeptidase [Lachnospiraceae bacterium]|nr:zinc metallopeptidase [Lachnospiraceae bacterium]